MKTIEEKLKEIPCLEKCTESGNCLKKVLSLIEQDRKVYQAYTMQEADKKYEGILGALLIKLIGNGGEITVHDYEVAEDIVVFRKEGIGGMSHTFKVIRNHDLSTPNK